MHAHNQYDLNLFIVEENRINTITPCGDVAIAAVNKNIIFEIDALSRYHYDGWSPIHHDLLLVAAAVEYADRCVSRRVGRWARNFNITVPVVEIETWRQSPVQRTLRTALRLLTGDHWHFVFTPWQGANVFGTRQRSLPFPTKRSAVIAYSDGLDSRCVAKMSGHDAVCVRLTKYRDKRKAGDEPFDQFPFWVKMPATRENSNRSRAFKFAIVTAIAAHLAGIGRIIVPESGQGALGPALAPLHNVYVDYRNHPTFLRKMEQFVKEVLSHCVRYEQPRLWFTKGETISKLLSMTSNATIDLIETRSCWQRRWNTGMGGKLRQCGLCAACLLRRMSLHRAGVAEPADAYVITDLTARTFSEACPAKEEVRLSRTIVQYGIAGVGHLQRLANMANLPDPNLKVSAFEIAHATGEPLETVLENLRRMLLAHATEWRDFVTAQGRRGFLRSWTQGARHA